MFLQNNSSGTEFSEEFSIIQKEFEKQFNDFDDNFHFEEKTEEIPLVPDISNIITPGNLPVLEIEKREQNYMKE